MPRLSVLVPNRADVNVPIGSGSIRVTFNPSLMTPELTEDMQHAQETGSVKGTLYGPLSDMLLGWDLTDDEDQELPTDEGTLRCVPLQVLIHVFQALIASVTDQPTISSLPAINGRSSRR